MELNVFHFNELAASRTILHLKKHFIVQSKLQLWHTAQKAAHVNAPKDLRPQHVSVGTNQDVEPFNDIEENLVLGMLYALGTP